MSNGKFDECSYRIAFSKEIVLTHSGACYLGCIRFVRDSITVNASERASDIYLPHILQRAECWCSGKLNA